MPRSRVSSIFMPESVALVGASDKPGSLGTVVLANLEQGGFRGPLYLVNPNFDKVGAHTVYANVREVPGDVDLAIIVTPAATVAEVITDCGEHGVRGAIVMSAGFREVGEAGRALEREVVRRARRYNLRFLGPNCLGVIRTDIGFNGTFSAANALPGHIGVISQSGALCTAILDWARASSVGFSSLISTGIGADVDFGEMLDFLALDPHTDSIMLYIEGVHHARRFMSALRAAARIKPVVVMKAGRHEAGSRAALSHTGALVGTDAVFDAALRRAGVLRVDSFSNFFGAASTLSAGMRTTGERLAVITNAGGPGVMAADHAAERGMTMAALAPASIARLDKALPASWSHGNPIDVLGDADPARYSAALSACLEDPGVDAVIVVLSPQALTAAEDVARAVVSEAKNSAKPVLTCWMGEPSVASSRELFRSAKLPTFRTPEAAVDAFAAISTYGRNQLQLQQVPEPLTRQASPDVDGARAVIEGALAKGRTVLSLPESKAVLAAFRIPIVPSLPAHSAGEAVTIAQEIGFPVAMKILSHDITHKTEVGGVRLSLADARHVRSEYQDLTESVGRLRPQARIDGVVIEPMRRMAGARELLVGVSRDEVFGPTISFGLGGTLVEIIKDSAVTLPPLNHYLVRDLIGRTRAARYLEPFRGAPGADVAAVEDLLLRVSEMVCELPWLVEMDLNPAIATAKGVAVLDARIVVEWAKAAARPYDHMAIHPYPSALVQTFELPEVGPVTLRPIRPEDAVIERDFVNALSDQSRYLRFMYALAEITPGMLARFTQIDYDREMALIAVVPNDGGELEVGVARYATLHDGDSCEFAIVVADAWQGKGLARRLMSSLIDVARERRLKIMRGVVLAENTRMLELARAVGFEVRMDPEDAGLMLLRMEL
jgi:acetyltransferase